MSDVSFVLRVLLVANISVLTILSSIFTKGFDWDPVGKRAAKEMSWDDGFQRLVCSCCLRNLSSILTKVESLIHDMLRLFVLPKVAFGEAQGHYNVPPPVSSDIESRRFYRWVQSLHLENRALQTGEESKLLSDTRLASLANIGFRFHP